MAVKERFKVCVAPHLILLKDNHVLLHLRHNTGFADGMFSRDRQVVEGEYMVAFRVCVLGGLVV